MGFLQITAITFILLLTIHASKCQVPGSSVETAQNLGGTYFQNTTIYMRNGPYRVTKDILVESGATVTIETGTRLYFDSGVGFRVRGTLRAIGGKWSRIYMGPYQEVSSYNGTFPNFRLTDGSQSSDGRLMVFYKDKWRAVCTQQTNWTRTDYDVACKSMGFGGGGFKTWYRRNNDTYPFVLSRPACTSGLSDLWDCHGLKNEPVKLGENLCQGEDDLGLYCWGPPTFKGYHRHWLGLQFSSNPFEYVQSDPDQVSIHKQSSTRLEYVDIVYAGFDGQTKNATAALKNLQGTPVFINDVKIDSSMGDGMAFLEPDAPVIVANSTITNCRGIGLKIENTTDGRVFINETRIENNFGPGVWYRHKFGEALAPISVIDSAARQKRQAPYFEFDKPELDFCRKHSIPERAFFPHYVEAKLPKGAVIPESTQDTECRLVVNLPHGLSYFYTLQFVQTINRNPSKVNVSLDICLGPAPAEYVEFSSQEVLAVENEQDSAMECIDKLYSLPIIDGVLPQSVSVQNTGRPLLLKITYQDNSQNVGSQNVDTNALNRQLFSQSIDLLNTGRYGLYGLNVTNSRIEKNSGEGLYVVDTRERLVVHNATIRENQGYAGILIKSGAGDAWINDTDVSENFGDGMNFTLAGGSLLINGTTLTKNRMRGFALHQNLTNIPVYPLKQEVIFKGRVASFASVKPTVIADNLWGGILVGNFCASGVYEMEKAQVLLSYISLVRNQYHPAFEVHSCERAADDGALKSVVRITGSQCEGGNGMCVRISPAVNMALTIDDNNFMNNSKPVLYIRNRHKPWLKDLPSEVKIAKNSFKYNKGQFIVHIGLNEDAPQQRLTFNQQNEIRENEVFNPYPYLTARSRPYAALVVSSSTNVKINRNCFRNPKAQYEIATDLNQHAKFIDAKLNNWGATRPQDFVNRVFDHFERYNLAHIMVDPFAAACNSQSPHRAPTLGYIKSFRDKTQPNVLGGVIYENAELGATTYDVIADLHIVPGARLEVAPGAVLKFRENVGMLVEGELVRTIFHNNQQYVTFTKQRFNLPNVANMRLFNTDSEQIDTQGRLEVNVDGEWGTVCNRSWTVDLAQRVCNQMGMIADPEFLENWQVHPPPGDLPIIMDIIRCEEMEYDLTKCRHDGPWANVNASCPQGHVVGVRCIEPNWAGVRYSLLANPPSVTGRRATMSHWVIEKAGLVDYVGPEFGAGLQLDWNYHSFNKLIVRDNMWTGLDVVYNDLIVKPEISDSHFINNRRHGVRLRSPGLTFNNVKITDNSVAGIRYNGKISPVLQRDVVTWLYSRPDSWQASNVVKIPNTDVSTIELRSGGDNSRMFLIAQPSQTCGQSGSFRLCSFQLSVKALSAVGGRIGFQVINRANNESDENIRIIVDGRTVDVMENLIDFPMISNSDSAQLVYTKSYGNPQIVLLLMFIDRSSYVDRFIHVLNSDISRNAYGLSTLHYSNFTHHQTGDIINRWDKEKIWIQKCTLSRNTQTVVWVNGPLRDVSWNSPIAEITYHIDNCSITQNDGSIIETHRDLHSSANVFHWKMWSSTMKENINSGVTVSLPESHDLLTQRRHKFEILESRFYNNDNFMIKLSGFHAFVNISSNNITSNKARHMADKSNGLALIIFRGMEKNLVMERNRFLDNKCSSVVDYDMQSQMLKPIGSTSTPARIQYNYFENNYFVSDPSQLLQNGLIWPRSFTLGVKGTQMVEVHYNRFRNPLMDFEIVVGLKGAQLTPNDAMNISHNFWGAKSVAGTLQRIFDFDKWNSYSLANYNPYYVSNENFIDWWWRPEKGQLGFNKYEDPSPDNLVGRLFGSLTLSLKREQWPTFPNLFKPERPYRITGDLTIMPGATLTIEKGVHVHVYPNVRILVLGTLIADGTFWQPIRFRPVNVTEFEEVQFAQGAGVVKKAGRWKRDIIYQKFPLLARQDTFYQNFSVHLVGGDNANNRFSGFFEIYNTTTGEMVPVCDRQFTERNAQVVCKQLGLRTKNAYFWIAPRYDYNPRLRIVKTYMEPRQCYGSEHSFSECDLRLNGDRDLWWCTDTKHFVYIHCANEDGVMKNGYVGNWGGIMFAPASYEMFNNANGDDESQASILRHVEIYGAGLAHNETNAAVITIRKTPSIHALNITNSSMHGMVMIAPSRKLPLAQLNFTDNNGIGLAILTLGFQGSSSVTGNQPRLSHLYTSNQGGNTPNSEDLDDAVFPNMGLASYPYELFGLLDMCGFRREIVVQSRILLWYKYDSYNVDCVKWFQSATQRPLGFRLLVANLYNSSDPAGRSDGLNFYADRDFSEANLIGRLDHTNQSSIGLKQMLTTRSTFLGIHMHANAASGKYGFIAEIAAMPSAPDKAPLQQVTIAASRFNGNARGAIRYHVAGDSGPDVAIDSCTVTENGQHVWGNFSTSETATAFHMQNTREITIISSLWSHNQGGLNIYTEDSGLQGIIKNSAFSKNQKFGALNLGGQDYQKIFIVNNFFGGNSARYYDTVYINHVTANITHNVFFNNTGAHILDVTGYPGSQTQNSVFSDNSFQDNYAWGHGFEYNGSHYGYLPGNLRVKRQSLSTASFDWWAHIGADTRRLRSTIYAGSAQQEYRRNFFQNALNPFELTVSNETRFDRLSSFYIDARENFWGAPGTPSVATGKIRDKNDYEYLIKVVYEPVLQSNTSLINGDCPAGWFQAGVAEYQSCYIFIGGAMNFEEASAFCRDQGGSIPYFRSDDARISQVASKVNDILVKYRLDVERYSTYQTLLQANLWVSGEDVPVGQCGALNTQTALIHPDKCQMLLAFVCEKGNAAYQEPFLWQPAGIAVIAIVSFLAFCIFLLLVAWLAKSRKRHKQFFARKSSLRQSLKSQKMADERQKYAEERLKELHSRQTYTTTADDAATTNNTYSETDFGTQTGYGRTLDNDDPILSAHKNMVLGHVGSLNKKKPINTSTSSLHSKSQYNNGGNDRKLHGMGSGASTSTSYLYSGSDATKAMGENDFTDDRSMCSPMDSVSNTYTSATGARRAGSVNSLLSGTSSSPRKAVPVRPPVIGNSPKKSQVTLRNKLLDNAMQAHRDTNCPSEVSVATTSYCSTCRASTASIMTGTCSLCCTECGQMRDSQVPGGNNTDSGSFSTISEGDEAGTMTPSVVYDDTGHGGMLGTLDGASTSTSTALYQLHPMDTPHGQQGGSASMHNTPAKPKTVTSQYASDPALLQSAHNTNRPHMKAPPPPPDRPPPLIPPRNTNGPPQLPPARGNKDVGKLPSVAFGHLGVAHHNGVNSGWGGHDPGSGQGYGSQRPPPMETSM